MLHTLICNVTEVYNVKETYNTACYLFFLRRKNKTMIKLYFYALVIYVLILKLLIEQKFIDCLKIIAVRFCPKFIYSVLGIKMAATVLRLRGPLRFCSAQGVRSACQVKITFWDYLQSLIILI